MRAGNGRRAITRIILVRHGETDWNHLKLAQGHADVELNEAGRAQAREVAGALSEESIHAVYSSDLRRAVDTAHAIAAGRGLDVQVDRAFREIDQGDWEGLHVDEIRRRWPDLWGPARHHRSRPGGESPAEVRRRALAGLRRVIEERPDQTVVVVTHGGTIRWISAEALGYDDIRSATIRGVGNGGIVSFDARIENGRLRLTDLERMDRATTDLEDPND
jgi:alpha-ribazole phosphatase